MMVLTDEMVVFGHTSGLLSLWDTSKRVLDKQELHNLRESITTNEVKQIDIKHLVARNLSTSREAIARNLPVV